MRKRSRAHEAGSVEAGSSISKSFFLLIASLGQSLGIRRGRSSSQIEPLDSRSSQPGRARSLGWSRQAPGRSSLRAGLRFSSLLAANPVAQVEKV